MEIKYKPRPVFKGQNEWYPKTHGVIFVESQETLENLFKALVEQDDYWEEFKNILKVLPQNLEISHSSDLSRYCEWGGKTDIYDVQALRDKGFNFLIYQHPLNVGE